MGKVSLTFQGYMFGGVCAMFGVAASTFYFLNDAPEPTVIHQEDGTEIVLPKGPEVQSTASIWKEVDGRDYLIWEGHVVEEPDNSLENKGSVSVNYDADIYNFDLGIIIHGVYSGKSTAGDAGLSRTLFNELADNDGNLPPHIEKVRKIGCDIAQEYFTREASQKYQETPADVVAYHRDHCGNI